MSRRPAGPLPWSGSRARSRDRGYADALKEVFSFAQELERSPLMADEQMEAMRTWAFDTWLATMEPALTVGDLDGYIGLWDSKPAPAEDGPR
jgi:hypothetical protein